MKSSHTRSLRKHSGQGMTEYIIIVALIAIAAIGVFTMFGNTVSDQVSAMTQELAGQDGSTQISDAVGNARNAATKASGDTTLGTYGGQSR